MVEQAATTAVARRHLRRWWCAAACCLLAACASHKTQVSDADLLKIEVWLPGTYDNVAQHDADLKAGRDAHAALTLTIVKIDQSVVGDHSYYVLETAADDPQRVTSQRIFTFASDDHGHVINVVRTFTDPLRWRDAENNPVIFSGLVATDVKTPHGCEVHWTRKGEVEASHPETKAQKKRAANQAENNAAMMLGANDPKRCEVTGATHSAAALDMHVELTADGIALAEQYFDSNGRLVQGSAGDAFYRFHRQ